MAISPLYYYNKHWATEIFYPPCQKHETIHPPPPPTRLLTHETYNFTVI